MLLTYTTQVPFDQDLLFRVKALAPAGTVSVSLYNTTGLDPAVVNDATDIVQLATHVATIYETVTLTSEELFCNLRSHLVRENTYVLLCTTIVIGVTKTVVLPFRVTFSGWNGDPSTIPNVIVGTTRTVSFAAQNFSNIILARNGKLYCAPYASERCVEIDPTTPTAQSRNFGVVITEDWKYYTGAMGGNGKLYYPPVNTTHVLMIDPEARDSQTIGNSLGAGTGKYQGAIADDAGNVIFPPFCSNYTLHVDVATNTITQLGSDLGTGVNKYYCAAKAPNGKIYCPPFATSRVLEIDPINRTTQLVGTAQGFGSKFWAACTAPNGMIYCIPRDGRYVMKLDPTTGTTTNIADLGTAVTYKYYRAILARNGKIYCPPYRASKLMVINPATDAVTFVGDSFPEGAKFYDGILAPNDKIYCPPYSATASVLEIDTLTDTMREIGGSYGLDNYKWYKGALGPDGKIYVPPYNYPGMLIIE